MFSFTVFFFLLSRPKAGVCLLVCPSSVGPEVVGHLVEFRFESITVLCDSPVSHRGYVEGELSTFGKFRTESETQNSQMVTIFRTQPLERSKYSFCMLILFLIIRSLLKIFPIKFTCATRILIIMYYDVSKIHVSSFEFKLKRAIKI